MADSAFITALAMAIDKALTEMVYQAAVVERLNAKERDALALAVSGLVAGRLEASLDPTDDEAVELVQGFKRIGAHMVAMTRNQTAADKGRPH